MEAHNVVLNNLPQGRSVVKPIKNGVRILSPKRFNGYVDQNKKYLNTFILDLEKFILKKV